MLTIWAVPPLWVSERTAWAFIWSEIIPAALLTASGIPGAPAWKARGFLQGDPPLSVLPIILAMVSTASTG